MIEKGTTRVLCLVAGMIWGATSFAHGVRHSVFEGAAGVEVSYDDGTPMRHCKVEVFSPSDKETAFQQGFTDKNGRFTFFPDASGIWHVTVDDGMGHGLSQDIEIEEGTGMVKRDRRQFSRFQGVIIGLSLILGLFGVASFFLRWKRSEQQG